MNRFKKRRPSSGVFQPEEPLVDFLEERGDLRAVFDRVHTHFFESLGEPVDVASGDRRKKGESHVASHAR